MIRMKTKPRQDVLDLLDKWSWPPVGGEWRGTVQVECEGARAAGTPAPITPSYNAIFKSPL